MKSLRILEFHQIMVMIPTIDEERIKTMSKIPEIDIDRKFN